MEDMELIDPIPTSLLSELSFEVELYINRCLKIQLLRELVNSNAVALAQNHEEIQQLQHSIGSVGQVLQWINPLLSPIVFNLVRDYLQQHLNDCQLEANQLDADNHAVENQVMQLTVSLNQVREVCLRRIGGFDWDVEEIKLATIGDVRTAALVQAWTALWRTWKMGRGYRTADSQVVGDVAELFDLNLLNPNGTPFHPPKQLAELAQQLAQL